MKKLYLGDIGARVVARTDNSNGFIVPASGKDQIMQVLDFG